MKDKRLRYMLEYGALRALLAVFGVLGVDRASAAGGALFRAIGPRMGIHRVAVRNLKRTFPQWGEARIQATALGMWDNLGRVVAEYPYLEQIGRERVTFINPEYVPDAGPVVLVSGHTGNWEVLPQALLTHYNMAINPVYRAPNNPYVDRLILKYRSARGRLRSFGKNRKGLGESLKALQEGEAVGMLIDQKMNTGIEAAFFGRPAMTSTAFVELCRKISCPLIPGRIVRKSGCYFEVTPYPAIAYEGRDTADVVAEVHNLFEGWITEHPEQWLWLHRRWKD